MQRALLAESWPAATLLTYGPDTAAREPGAAIRLRWLPAIRKAAPGGSKLPGGGVENPSQ